MLNDTTKTQIITEAYLDMIEKEFNELAMLFEETPQADYERWSYYHAEMTAAYETLKTAWTIYNSYLR